MDIGAGKDLGDYSVDGTAIPYHLIDICEPGTKYNVFKYQHDFFDVFRRLRNGGKIPVLCGGSGMYIEAVLKGYNLPDVPPDPELRRSLSGKSLRELEEILASCKTLHNKTDVDSVQRAIRAIEIEAYCQKRLPVGRSEFAPVNSLIIGINIDRERRRENISSRLRLRLAAGMVDEVRALLDSGVRAEDLIDYGLEYKYLTLYVTGRLSLDEMTAHLEIAIHRFAKRQMTWFRGMERRGFVIHWIEASLPVTDKINRTIALMNQTK